MTKQQLQEYYWLKKNIKKLKERLLELESEAKRVTAVYSKTKASGKGSSKDRMADIVLKIVDTQDQIKTLFYASL